MNEIILHIEKIFSGNAIIKTGQKGTLKEQVANIRKVCEAIADLALFYSNRNFLLEEEQIQTYEEERERWLTELENSNDGDAMFIYASEVRERESVKYSWYLKAAERGSRDAAREVAFRLAVGWALKRTSSNRSASETKCWKRLRKREANESRPRRARRLTREKSSLNRPGAEGLC